MGHSYLVNTYNIAAVAFYSSIVLYYSLPILLIYNTFLWYSCACWCHGSSTQVCCYEQSYTERDSACCHSLTHTATSVTPICISPLTKYLIEMCNMISDKYMCVFVCVYVYECILESYYFPIKKKLCYQGMYVVKIWYMHFKRW